MLDEDVAVNGIPHVVEVLRDRFKNADVNILMDRARARLIPNPDVWRNMPESWRKGAAGLVFAHLSMKWTAIAVHIKTLARIRPEVESKLRDAVVRALDFWVKASITLLDIVEVRDIGASFVRFIAELMLVASEDEVEKAILCLIDGVEDTRLRVEVSNIAGSSVAKRSLKTALKIFEKAEDIAEDIGLKTEYALTKANKAIILHHLKMFSEANKNLRESIEIIRSLISSGRTELRGDLSSILMNLGNMLGSRGKYEEALKAYDEAEEIRRKLLDEGVPEMRRALATLLLNKSYTLRKMGRNEEAEKAYREAEMLSKS